MLVIRELISGSQSFNDIRRGVPLMSPSLLSSRLKMLEGAGVIDRQATKEGVEYTLTKAGTELQPIIFQMAVWGQRWVRSDMSKKELDPKLLMWDIKRGLNHSFFTATRTVLQFDFEEYRLKMKRWWLVVQPKEIDVCLKDPGYEVDLFIRSGLKTLTQVWMGDLKISKAISENRLEISGNAHLRKNFAKWLGRNPFADVKPASRP